MSQMRPLFFFFFFFEAIWVVMMLNQPRAYEVGDPGRA